MTYLIENANVYENDKFNNFSMIIEDDHIKYRGKNFNKYSYMKTNYEAYIMTPTFIIYDNQILKCLEAIDLKEYIINHLIKCGCTTFLTSIRANYENEILPKMKYANTLLLNSPLDYVIGIEIPLQQLTTSFLRLCKKEKIAAIFISVKDDDELEQLPWGWLREAIFPYNAPLIPVFTSRNERSKRQLQIKWARAMKEHKMPSLLDEINSFVPLPIHVMNKIGIYPKKGSLIQGVELSYNLFLKTTETSYDTFKKLTSLYHEAILLTVNKGEVIRCGENVRYKPGCGEQLKIRTPAFFTIP